MGIQLISGKLTKPIILFLGAKAAHIYRLANGPHNIIYATLILSTVAATLREKDAIEPTIEVDKANFL